MKIKSLKIKNLALIESADIDFKSGLTSISGETGSGKSIFIKALTALSGEKIKSDKESSIESIIELDDEMSKMLVKLDICDKKAGNNIIVRRLFGKKNKTYIEDSLVSLDTLKKLLSSKFEICSQHENQSILSSSEQINVIDRYCVKKDRRTISLLNDLNSMYAELREMNAQLKALVQSQSDLSDKRDYFLFQLEEIQNANISSEDESLQEQISRFENSAKIEDILKDIKSITSGDNGVLVQMKELIYFMNNLSKETKNERTDKLEELYYSLKEEINNLDLPVIDEDEDTYLALVRREEELSKLIKKHGSIKEIILKEKELHDNLDTIDNFDKKVTEIQSQIKTIEDNFDKAAKELSDIRIKQSMSFQREMEGTLKDLNMPFVLFKVLIQEKDRSFNGKDSVEFLISQNKKDEPKSIKEVASGGELSRITLAIRSLSQKEGVVFLFDEVDTGIGGGTAFNVGNQLHKISKMSQVLCISHLPQVVAFGDNHLKVEKIQEKEKTTSIISKIKDEDLLLELSRMIGGNVIGDKALITAKEILKKVKDF